MHVKTYYVNSLNAKRKSILIDFYTDFKPYTGFRPYYVCMDSDKTGNIINNQYRV